MNTTTEDRTATIPRGSYDARVTSIEEKPHENWRIDFQIAAGPHEGKTFNMNLDRYERIDKQKLLKVAGAGTAGDLPGRIVHVRLPGSIQDGSIWLTPYYVRWDEQVGW